MVPIGTIAIWYSSVATIPDGWRLCNGNYGTPDLRDKYLRCAGLTYNPNDTGGSTTHHHTFTSPGHSHNISFDIDLETGNDYQPTTSTETEVGTTSTSNHLPLTRALPYIIRVKET